MGHWSVLFIFSHLLHVSEINFCLSLDSLALHIPCAAALLSSPNTFPLLPASCPARVICVRAPAAEFLYSFFFLNWSTALYVTATNNKYLYKCCTCAWLNKVTALFFPKLPLWNQGLVFLKTVATDLQHIPPADSHSSCSLLGCSVYPKPLSHSVFLLPWVHVPEFADARDDISVLCWMLTKHDFVLIIHAPHFFPSWAAESVTRYLSGSSAVCYYSLCWRFVYREGPGRTKGRNYPALYPAARQVWGTYWIYLFAQLLS